MSIVKNPILPGFYPDPSICAVEDDFYLVTSTFAYFPGVPIFHSKDLSNWEQIGNILTRESQLKLYDCGHSAGIYAPTIRYHDGTFYMITTNVSDEGNFIVTATKPEGPWSDPYFLGDGAEGFDPSLFFDEDGRCYYVGTREHKGGARYNGDVYIWLQEIDLVNMKLIGESQNIWKGAMVDAVWPEAPHIYKKDDYYYLMIAEGGTMHHHSITVARSKNIHGPYESNLFNPIFTHRHMGKDYPIQYVGHADLVETKNGEWYMVMLASRPIKGHSNLGRETFLAKVIWEDGWPVVNPGEGKLLNEMVVNLQTEYVEPRANTYHFFQETLDHRFLMLRNERGLLYSLKERKGYLRLYLKKEQLSEKSNPSYLGIRQQHHNYMVETMMEFVPKDNEESAGLAIVQSDEYHIRYEYTMELGKKVIKIVSCEAGMNKILKKVEVDAERIYLKIMCKNQKLFFYYQYDEKNRYELLEENIDISNLSTEVAGGFVGCTVGMYASGNGRDSINMADFAWFTYEQI